jgi:hypothetical protein
VLGQSVLTRRVSYLAPEAYRDTDLGTRDDLSQRLAIELRSKAHQLKNADDIGYLDLRCELSLIGDRDAHRSATRTYTTTERRTLFDIKLPQSSFATSPWRDGPASRTSC